MKKEAENAKSYLFWGIITIIIILSYLLLKDLLIALITSLILAFISLPLHKKLSKTIKNEKISAFLVVLGVMLVLIAIIVVFVTSFINQVLTFLTGKNLSKLVDIISKIIDSDIIRNNLQEILNEVARTFIQKIPSTITYAPLLLLNAFVIFFTMFYILLEWEKLEKIILDIIPFKERKQILDKIKLRTQNIVSGTFFIAILELIIAAIFLKALGIGPYLILAFAIGLLAFIPSIGPAIIWIPLAIVEILYGKIGVAIGVIIMGLIISTGIDFILRIKFIGKRTGTHPVIILLGILGGITLFGFIGIIIGPLILSILVTIIENLPSTINDEN
jgi:predicted PurR-regulated permease PerM